MEEEKKQSEEENMKSRVNTGLISLEISAQLNRIDIDMRSIVREFGIETADISPEELIRIAKKAGFKIKQKEIAISDIVPKYPLPAILRMKDGTYCVLLGVKADEGNALILNPLHKHPQSISISDLENSSP